MMTGACSTRQGQILAPGMGDDGKLEKAGVPAALVNAYFTGSASSRRG